MLDSGVIIEIGSMAAEIDRALASEEYRCQHHIITLNYTIMRAKHEYECVMTCVGCRNGSCFVQSSIAAASAQLMPASLPMRKKTINTEVSASTTTSFTGSAGAARAPPPAAVPSQALHDPNAPDALVLNKVCCLLHHLLH